MAAAGHDCTFEETRRAILEDYNPRCDPAWSEKDLEHKFKDVDAKCNRPRGYLLEQRRERPPRPRTTHHGRSTERSTWRSADCGMLPQS